MEYFGVIQVFLQELDSKFSSKCVRISSVTDCLELKSILKGKFCLHRDLNPRQINIYEVHLGQRKYKILWSGLVMGLLALCRNIELFCVFMINPGLVGKLISHISDRMVLSFNNPATHFLSSWARVRQWYFSLTNSTWVGYKQQWWKICYEDTQQYTNYPRSFWGSCHIQKG